MATIGSVAPDTLITSAWGNSVVSELNNQCLKKTGGTMSGALLLPSTQATGPTAAIHKGYADATYLGADGGTMTGLLTVGGDPLEPHAGVSMGVGGRINTTQTSAGQPNLYCNRQTAEAVPPGQPFVRFERSGLLVGQITIASSTSVAYGTTSDPRLKQATGDVADAATLARTLGSKAYRGRWIADQGQGQEWVFLNSTDVQPVAPYAVQGTADAVDTEGHIVPQQVDHSALVPLLFAALAQALDRIAALEAA